MKSITEELRFRQRAVEFAIKYGNNAKAAKRYHTSRQQIKRWRDRYDGTIDSLRPLSRRPHSHPNQHTNKELELIKEMYGRYKSYGLAEVYVKLKAKEYTRSFCSMQRQIKKLNILVKEEKKRQRRTSKSKYEKPIIIYPGQLVQIDIKYVPLSSLEGKLERNRYYQITAIDMYSRKRVLKIVEEASTYETSKFMMTLEKKMGFKIKAVQTDNGSEFVNTNAVGRKTTLFEETLKKLKIVHKTTRPYSPWQNGMVERSHRIDGERFYDQRTFKTVLELKKALKRYNSRYNNIHRQVLNFKSPNKVIKEYLESVI